MNIELIVCILLGILLAVSTLMAGEYWKEKEHYRCRVFDLTDGKEGSNLVKVVPYTPPPPPPPEKPAAPEGMFRPLLTEWFDCGNYGCFRKRYVVNLTKNPNDTINVVLVNGTSINTGLKLDQVKDVLGVHYMPSMEEELKRWKK